MMGWREKHYKKMTSKSENLWILFRRGKSNNLKTSAPPFLQVGKTTLALVDLLKLQAVIIVLLYVLYPYTVIPSLLPTHTDTPSYCYSLILILPHIVTLSCCYSLTQSFSPFSLSVTPSHCQLSLPHTVSHSLTLSLSHTNFLP